MIQDLDVIVARNQLLDIFHLDAPYEGEVPDEDFEYPTQLLEGLLDIAAEQGLFDNEVNNFRVNFEARIMGAMMPRAGEVARTFEQLRREKGVKAATDYFYKLCIDSTTSAPPRSPRTSSGKSPPATATWRSPST